MLERLRQLADESGPPAGTKPLDSIARSQVYDEWDFVTAYEEEKALLT